MQATLTAYPAVSDTFDITITPPVTSIPTNYGIGTGAVKVPLYQYCLQITATCLPAAGVQTVNYSSSNTKVANVDQDGWITLLATGTAKITVAATDGSGTKSVITVTVTK